MLEINLVLWDKDEALDGGSDLSKEMIPGLNLAWKADWSHPR